MLIGSQKGDINDVANLEDHAKRLISDFPTIDTVIINAGIQESFFFADPTSSSTASISNEITTNFIAPSVLCRVFIPHLLSLKREGTLVTVSSGLGYVPLPFYPIYCATKAAIHSLSVTLRAQLAGTNMNIIELVPPYVDTGLDAAHRERINNMLPGEGPVPMPLDMFIREAVAGLETRDADGTPPREISAGLQKAAVEAWSEAIRPILRSFGVDG